MMLVTLYHADRLHQYCEARAKVTLLDELAFLPLAAFISPEGELVALGIDWPKEITPLQAVACVTDLLMRMLGDGRAVAYATAAIVSLPDEYRSAFRDAIRVHVYLPDVLNRYTYMTYEVQPWWRIRRLLKCTLVKYYEAVIVPLMDEHSKK